MKFSYFNDFSINFIHTASISILLSLSIHFLCLLIDFSCQNLELKIFKISRILRRRLGLVRSSHFQTSFSILRPYFKSMEHSWSTEIYTKSSIYNFILSNLSKSFEKYSHLNFGNSVIFLVRGECFAPLFGLYPTTSISKYFHLIRNDLKFRNMS